MKIAISDYCGSTTFAQTALQRSASDATGPFSPTHISHRPFAKMNHNETLSNLTTHRNSKWMYIFKKTSMSPFWSNPIYLFRRSLSHLKNKEIENYFIVLLITQKF